MLSALFVLFSLVVYAASETDFVELKARASNILEEVIVLRYQVAALQKEVDRMDADLEIAKSRLKKISVASREARRHRKTIKDVEPLWESQSAHLQFLKQLLQTKQASFQMMEEEMSHLQDAVAGALMEDIQLSLR